MDENNFIPRCPKCLLVPSIKLIYENNDCKIEYNCQNKHSDIIPFNLFEKDCQNFSLEKVGCLECKKEKEKNKELNYFYCFQCQQTICGLCVHKHKNIQQKHILHSLENFDGTCLIHNNSYDFFCLNCNMNICSICKEKEHKYHKLQLISSYILGEDIKLEIDLAIKEILEIKTKMNSIQKSINEAFEKIKNNSLNVIQFMKHLLYAYNYEVTYNNLNFNVINNLKSFKKNIEFQIENVFKTIFPTSDKYIKFLKRIENINENKLKNNTKTLNYHNREIRNVIFLSDGRLSSCSYDNSIIIYNKNNYQIDSQIKDTCEINYHCELNNNNIISCCKDNTMKIYDYHNSFCLIETIKGHNDNVRKVIEMKNNILVSCSADKTMKIWKKDENNNYRNINTIIIADFNNETNILKINEHKLVSSDTDFNYIKFWDINNNFTLITTIKNDNYCGWRDSMCVIKDDLLLIGTYSIGIYVIDTVNYKIISNLLKKDFYEIFSIIELSNTNILIGLKNNKDKKYYIIEYKYENNNLIEIRSKPDAHEKAINGFIEMYDGTIISYSDDKTIKFWS